MSIEFHDIAHVSHLISHKSLTTWTSFKSKFSSRLLASFSGISLDAPRSVATKNVTKSTDIAITTATIILQRRFAGALLSLVRQDSMSIALYILSTNVTKIIQ